MKLTVRLFASLREELGRETVVVELGNPATVAELLKAFSSDYPGARSVGQALVAVNQEIARPETRLGEGDEVALLPPVSGG